MEFLFETMPLVSINYILLYCNIICMRTTILGPAWNFLRIVYYHMVVVCMIRSCRTSLGAQLCNTIDATRYRDAKHL